MVDAVTGVTAATQSAALTASDSAGLNNPKLTQAFNQMLVGYAQAILSPATNDASDAANDTTSEPEGPGGSG